MKGSKQPRCDTSLQLLLFITRMFLSLAVPSPLLSKIITSHLKSQRSKHIAALYVTIQPKELITTKWGYT